MSEYAIGYAAAGSIAGLAATCLFYMLGGRSGKWRRRYVASLIQAVNSNVCAAVMGVWSPWLLAIYPLAIAQTSLGYGADSGGGKVLRRALCALASLTIGVLFSWLYGGLAWLVFVANVGVAAWSVWLGVKNPLYAAAEEVFVCALLFLMTCAYPFTAGGHG